MTDDFRAWQGQTVTVTWTDDPRSRRKPIEIQMTEQGARDLLTALMRLRQTFITLTQGQQEALDALGYVLLGDPARTEKHRKMEAAKGMTPDGGYRTPAPINDLPANLPMLGGPGMNHSGTASGSTGSC